MKATPQKWLRFALTCWSCKAARRLPLRRSDNAIPTVFVMITDPLGQGFVNNLAHPAGHMTGFSDYDPPIASKWVELLKQIKPAIASVSLLYNPASTPFADLILRAVQPAARSLAVTAAPRPVATMRTSTPR